MTNTKSTKRALLASVMAMLLCFTMLLGTTFAWFTDSVTSGNNIIKSGTLDVEMYWAYGTEAPDSATWTDASTGAIFNYDKWEPGYVEVRHIKIANVGTLALKYQIKIVANGEVSDLADVIDVYYVDPAVQVSDRAQLTDANKLGTLTEVLANLANTANGELAANTADTITLALKMQESADNEYQNLAIGSDFSVVLMATQLTAETDSFDDQYDKDAEYKEPSISVATFEQLKAAFAKGGNVELTADIAITELVTIPAGVEVYLDMNGKTITPASANVDPLFDVKTGAALVIDGNGTFDLGEMGTVNGMSLMYPRGDVTINSGTFKIATNGTKYGSMFVGINGGKGKLIINGGYFDGGYYKEGDCFNNCRNLINGSWGQYIRIYGGTFVGQNPAWGDEGMAFLCPHCTHTPGQGYCQALFLEGQSREDTELPEGYTITEGTTADGRPTYTVNYSK